VQANHSSGHTMATAWATGVLTFSDFIIYSISTPCVEQNKRAGVTLGLGKLIRCDANSHLDWHYTTK